MSLSRKHYIEIAKLILELRDVDWRFDETIDEGLSDFISSLCYYLKQDNPNFDYKKFETACGFPKGLYPEEEYD
jgi:hypothetical protein